MVEEWQSRRRRRAAQEDLPDLSPSTNAAPSDAHAARETLLSRSIPYLTNVFNSVTGYSSVQDRKERVNVLDEQLVRARTDMAQRKQAYEDVIAERKACARELNSLLQRKDSWMESDVTRFTTLYRDDITLDQREGQAKMELKAASDLFDHQHILYLNEIRERYIEEGLYSDKIRRASTWWTWGLILTHFLLFLSVQLFFEPRKRRQLLEQLQLAIAASPAAAASSAAAASDARQQVSSGGEPGVDAAALHELDAKLDQLLHWTVIKGGSDLAGATSPQAGSANVPVPGSEMLAMDEGSKAPPSISFFPPSSPALLSFVQGLLLGSVLTALAWSLGR